MMREIGFGRVAAVHGLEDAVAARLHRQVQIGHQLVDLGVGGDQVVVHVGRVAGRVADALDAFDRRDCADQVGEAARAVAPCIHVLAEQGDLASAGLGELPRLGEHASHCREISAPRV